MSDLLRRVAREPVAIGGFLVALYGALVAFHVLILSATQIGAITTLAGAAVALLRWLVTPSVDVIAQLDASGNPVAGGASAIETGTPVVASVRRRR